MSSTTFQDYNQNTPIVSAWLNDVNNASYSPGGKAKLAVQSAAAWVRFSVSGGVPSIQQSSNISTVVRSSAGVFVITYGSNMNVPNNCYSISQVGAGFTYFTGETLNSVTVDFTNASNVLTDPTAACVTIFANN